MSSSATDVQPPATAGSPAPKRAGSKTARDRIAPLLSLKNMAVIYVWIALVVIFGALKPDLFLTEVTLQRVMNEYAITGLAAVSIVLPLAARTFDLSIGSTIGLSGIIAGWLLGNTGLPVELVILAAIASGLLVGTLNAIVVVWWGIDSFIGTLATGSVIAAVTLGLSGDQILTERTSGDFASFATSSIAGIQMPFIYLLVVVLMVGYVLEQTVFGRHTYATGFNPDTAALIGIKVKRVQVITLLCSGVLASLAGVALTARIEAADPSNGASYLIPAFSAAFLGATQFRNGRFNPWGALVSVLMLGTGSIGLLLMGAPQWAPQVFQGAVLIIAVGLTVRQARRKDAA